MAQQVAPAYMQEDILSVAEAAAYLRVSEPTVRQLCHLVEGEADRIPNFRLGTAIRIPFWGLVNWISRRSGAGLPQAASRSKMRAKSRRITRRRRRING